MKNIFSIDVEDWYHLFELDDSYNDVNNWDSLPQRIEHTFYKLLDVLEKHETRSTCFFLGWIAEKYPQLVKYAYSKGHEIAYHGYSHRLLYQQKYSDFYKEAEKSLKCLEDITGEPIDGFRAPGFSLTTQTRWAYDVLIKLGFKYSSSVYPYFRSYGYDRYFGTKPKLIRTEQGELVEFPVTALQGPFGLLNCFGGGYFRFFPYVVFRFSSMMAKLSQQPIVFYIHPRDIDPQQPRLDLSFNHYFRSYVNLKGAESKLNRVLTDYSFTTFRHAINHLDREKLATLNLDASLIGK